MKKSQLIKKLQELPGGDDISVIIFDHLKVANTDDGDGNCEGLYSDFEVHLWNDDLSTDELEFIKEAYDREAKPFIALLFDNPDEADVAEPGTIPQVGADIRNAMVSYVGVESALYEYWTNLEAEPNYHQALKAIQSTIKTN